MECKEAPRLATRTQEKQPKTTNRLILVELKQPKTNLMVMVMVMRMRMRMVNG
jgi:hypothetical protein